MFVIGEFSKLKKVNIFLWFEGDLKWIVFVILVVLFLYKLK